MAWTGNSMTTLPPAVQTFYDKTLLKRALPKLVHADFAENRPYTTYSGQVIKFRRFESLGIGTLITEGVNPDISAASYSEVTATLVQYGYLLGISDICEFTNEDKVLTEFAMMLGEQMGLTVDTILRNIYVTGTQVWYANKVASRAQVVSKALSTDFDGINHLMRRNNCEYWTTVTAASTGVGTTPVRPAWAVIVHPDVLLDIEGFTGYKPFAEYPSQTGVGKAEEGAYKNFRFFSSTNAYKVADAGGNVPSPALRSTSGTKIDIYCTLIISKNALAKCPFDKLSQKYIAHPRGSGNDYLELNNIVGWKWTGTGAILDNKRLVRYESGATA